MVQRTNKNMKLKSYNPDTEPLASLVEEILDGYEVETPVLSKSEGDYIRRRLTAIFAFLEEDIYSSTGIKWPRPIPHLVREDWKEEDFSGVWKIKVDWTRKTRKKVARFNRIKE